MQSKYLISARKRAKTVLSEANANYCGIAQIYSSSSHCTKSPGLSNLVFTFISLTASFDMFQVCYFHYMHGGQCHKSKWGNFL